MKVKAVLKQDIQRRIFWFSGSYLMMFAILGLVPPFLNYFFGDMFDVNDYISAMNFINSMESVDCPISFLYIVAVILLSFRYNNVFILSYTGSDFNDL